MKIFLTLCIAFFTNFTLEAQCSRDAPLEDGPDYTVSGTATIEFKTDDTKVLKLSPDFSTQSGPDLDIYLANNSRLDNSSEKVNLGTLSSVSGAQEYSIPASISINQYSHIVLHCTQFNQHWGQGVFGTTEGADCSTLSVENTTGEKSFKIYPNPVQNRLKIEGLEDEAIIKIYSIDGRLVQVYEKKNTLNNMTISVEQLAIGIYSIHIITKKSTSRLKLQKT